MGFRPDPVNPDLLVLRQGGGCVAVFGAPFLLVGLFVLSLAFWTPQGSGEKPPLPVALGFGFVFAAVGAALVLGRAGTELDRRTRTYRKWWGLLGPFRVKTGSLAEFKAVVVEARVVSSDKSSHTEYPVTLSLQAEELLGPEARKDPAEALKSAGHPILGSLLKKMGASARQGGTVVWAQKGNLKLESGGQYQAARKTAEELARFLDLKLIDLSTGTPVVRSPDELDKPLAERLSGKEIEMPPPPHGMGLVFRAEGNSAVFELPQGRRALVGVWLLVAAGGPVAALFIWPAVRDLGFGAATAITALAALVPFLIGMTGVYRLFIRERIVASPEGVRFERASPVSEKSEEIRAEKLEDLTLVEDPGRSRDLELTTTGLVARSDEKTLVLGRRLPPEELRWMKAVIEKVLALGASG